MKLTKDQARVVQHGDGPLLVEAGPGAGKTRVLMSRVKRLLSEVEGHFRVLALTFTNKAANEMKERMDIGSDVSARAFIGTIHSFCSEVIAHRGQAIGLSEGLVLMEGYEDRLGLLGNAVRSNPELQDALLAAGDHRAQAARLRAWLDKVSEYKANLMLPGVVEDVTMRMIYEAYDAELAVSRSIDYDDLLLLAYRIFEEAPKIASFYRRQYRYICVDEAQDMNEAQYRMLCALCKDAHKNVMMVGDPKQAIYVWNGASPKYMELFRRDFGAETVRLNENFRSAASVVRVAQCLEPQYKVDAQLPIEGKVVLQTCADESAEARFVSEHLVELVKNGHPDIDGAVTLEGCAVLGRNRFVFGKLEECLRTMNIGYTKRLKTGQYESESEVVRAFELAMRVALNPHDRLHLRALLQALGMDDDVSAVRLEARSGGMTPHSVIRDVVGKSAVKWAKAIGEASVLAVGDGVSRFLDAVQVVENAANHESEEERALALEDLKVWRKNWNVYIRQQSGGRIGLREFFTGVALGVTDQTQHEGVALLSVHSAKGMEFDVVFLIGMCEGVFPDYRAREDTMAEERRSAFVAVTRARRLLFVSYPQMRMMPWGDPKRQSASRFFRDMEKGIKR